MAFCLFCTDVFGRSLTNPSHSPSVSLFRCCICLPAPQPSPQRPCPSDAGHPQASHRARLPPACSAASPTGRLDQGRWCAAALANEAARRCAGGGRPESRLYHRSYISFTHDVCRANWGKDYQECCICSYLRLQNNVTAAATNDNRHREEDCHILPVCKCLRVKNGRKGVFIIVSRCGV